VASLTLTADDDVRSYTLEEDECLNKNLYLLTQQVHKGEFVFRPVTLELLRGFHHEIFKGVRTHAGKVRSENFGQEYLVFGPNRSVQRHKVAAELSCLFQKLSRLLCEVPSMIDSESYEESSINIAVWAHAEIVRIHPFEDGNGRTSRLLLSTLLVYLKLKPIPIEACKQEYNDALNHYFKTNELQVLSDLFLRLYVS
jgi:Fic family protein